MAFPNIPVEFLLSTTLFYRRKEVDRLSRTFHLDQQFVAKKRMIDAKLPARSSTETQPFGCTVEDASFGHTVC